MYATKQGIAPHPIAVKCVGCEVFMLPSIDEYGKAKVTVDSFDTLHEQFKCPKCGMVVQTARHGVYAHMKGEKRDG